MRIIIPKNCPHLLFQSSISPQTRLSVWIVSELTRLHKDSYRSTPAATSWSRELYDGRRRMFWHWFKYCFESTGGLPVPTENLQRELVLDNAEVFALER
jgi:hypothetical protein